MFEVMAMINNSWSMVQSTLSTISGVLFSNSPESKTTRRPIGLDQLIQTKCYWVDRQREVFAELNATGELTPEALQLAIDELLGQLGARLGSPGVMLLELAELREKLTDRLLLEIIHDTITSIQASMIKGPKVAHACLVADIHLLLDET